MRKLQCFEVVKIFDHMLFLAAIQFNNITRGKLFGVIFNRFVYISGFYSIQFSNISVKDDLRIPDDNDFTFCFYNIFLMSHNFFFLSYSLAKKMQTSAKKACFQFAECSFSYAKIRLFLVTSKNLEKKYLKRGRRKKKNRRLPELRVAY